jgi:serine/threonine-protein kinase
VTKAKAKPDNTLNTILQAGQLVGGKYRVDHLLGEGGMAAVWAGTNERTGKRVALKVILRSLATTSEAQGLFQREALAASRVNHPNVVTVFDVIEHEGMACIIMERLDGEPLDSYIAHKGFLSVGEATALLLPAMRGVAAAHAQGVIHRDLKPQNIFICIGPDGRMVTTKVLDFGISVMVERVTDPSAGQVPALAMGTPAYMAPEHILGVGPVDERVDVYGFGVLLYEALTGQMPFPGEPGPDLFHRILNITAPRVTLFRPDLPDGLVRIIERAMAKQPGDRYSDLNLMVSALEDEILPSTPLPRLLMPLAGVPSLVARDVQSGDSEPAVLAIARREPSGPHQETMLYCARPPQKESGARNGGANAGSELARLPQPLGRETMLADLKPSLLRVPFSGVRSLLSPGGLRGLAGVGLAAVLGFGVWMAMQRPSQVQTPTPAPIGNATPPASEPAAQPVPAAAPTTAVLPAAVSELLEAPPSPPAAGALVIREHSGHSGHARGGPVPVMRSRSRVAAREMWGAPQPRKQAERTVLQTEESALEPPFVPSAYQSAKPAAPRAGRLSEDDF